MREKRKTAREKKRETMVDTLPLFSVSCSADNRTGEVCKRKRERERRRRKGGHKKLSHF